MSSSFNRLTVIGNLTRDPELRTTPKGTAVARFSLATNYSFTPEGGQERQETTFFDFEAWGKAGEIIAKYAKKGEPLFAEGRIRTDRWKDEQTQQERIAFRVVLENFRFIGGRRGADAPEGGAGDAPEPDDAPPRASAAAPSPAPAGPKSAGGGRRGGGSGSSRR